MTEWLDDFVVRSVAAGLIMVAVAAPMGCLMVWQRLAFLSDTLGHAAVLGVGLGLLLQVTPIVGVLAVALVIVFSLQRATSLNNALSETTLAIISHTGLAGGIIVLGLFPAARVNLDAILFGDLLATSRVDLLQLLVSAAVLLALLAMHWRAFVAVSVSREIAAAEGIPVRRVQILMLTMIALLIAVMMKVMGVLLIAAMLVIPTSSARLFSAGPEQMVGLSLVYGLAALAGGLGASFRFDWQTGPAIVVTATALLLASLAVKRALQNRTG